MKTVEGDLLQLAEDGAFDVIVHGCNCFCTMGAGIAKSIKQRFPEAYQADLKTEKGSRDKLGSYSFISVATSCGELVVVNGYTQYSYRRSRSPNLDYEAIRSVFAGVKEQFGDLRIGFPAIGAGFAGGDWEKIWEIIEEELADTDATFVRYVG